MKTIKAVKKFYIGERNNPQLEKPYYRAYGQLSKTSASQKSKTLYGSVSVLEFNTKDEYLNKIETLKSEGYTVNID